MANNLTDAAENLALDWLNPAITVPTRPTTPLKARLYTVIGTEAAGGTEVTGGSYVAGGQTITFGAASAGAATNSNLVSYTGMPACTVVAVEIWDSAGVPVRLWWGPLAANKVVNGGDTFTLPIGQVSISLD